MESFGLELNTELIRWSDRSRHFKYNLSLLDPVENPLLDTWYNRRIILEFTTMAGDPTTIRSAKEDYPHDWIQACVKPDTTQGYSVKRVYNQADIGDYLIKVLNARAS
jgi:hypothetical protein